LMFVPMPVSALCHESARRFKLATYAGRVLIRHEIRSRSGGRW